MYNSEVKELFLNSLEGSYREGTIKQYKNLFNKSAETEEIFDRDIYEMNLEQCKQLLKSYSNRSVDMFEVYCSMLKTYKAWSIKEGYDPSLINFFGMLTVDDAWDYIDRRAISERVTSYEDLLSFEKLVFNPQDLVVLILPFIGVSIEEMLDLKVKDIHENYIQLPNRQIPIDSKIHNIINEAIEQEDYFVGNGAPSGRITSMTINKTDYVLRRCGQDRFDQPTKPLVKNRINRMKKYLGKNISITNLALSGKVYMAKEIIKQKSEITKDDWMSINERFGVTGDKIYEYWSVTKQRVMPYLN